VNRTEASKGEAVKTANDEAREGTIRKDATAEHSFSEVARSLATGRTMSRRQALGWVGGALAGAALAPFSGSSSASAQAQQGAVAAAATTTPAQHGALLRGIEIAKKNRNLEGRFGLMFKKPLAFEPPDDLLTELAKSMAEPQNASPSETDNPDSPAGFTFLGQFIDHDMTFDNTPMRQQQQDPDALTNFRTALFDLDAVYGGGPTARPELYDKSDRDKLLIEGLSDPNRPDDLPRIVRPDHRDDGKAIIGDPRNDENLILSQMHLAFLKFHNALIDHVRATGSATRSVFEEARRLCRWHYQWMVVHDFLPSVVGQDTLNQILEERSQGPAKVKLSFYKPKNPNRPMMPIEYAAAAYRFGHSMVRPGYTINAQGGGAATFGPQPTEFNLNGSRRIPERLVIAWRHFFEIPRIDGSVTGPVTNPARLIDTDLSLPLFNLPSSVVPQDPPDPMVSLAQRNLIRGKRLGLASGQRVAQEMGVQALSNKELGLGNDPGWGGQAPLWYYILKEAELQNKGKKLGTVGGRIVAEVVLGLLERDKNAYLHPSNKGFWPQPPMARKPGVFLMGDLLKFAGVA
jgi:hypothetical protein